MPVTTINDDILDSFRLIFQVLRSQASTPLEAWGEMMMRRLPLQRACTNGEQKRLLTCFYNAGVPDVEVAVIEALPQCSGRSGNSPTSGLAKGLAVATGETANAKRKMVLQNQGSRDEQRTEIFPYPLHFDGSAETCVHLRIWYDLA